MTDSLPFCPDCGATLPPESPQALCPACLMRQALASRTIIQDGEKIPHLPPPSPEEIANKFPGYEILECLGRGGMGAVYKARQKSLNRVVAIKILAPERVGDGKFAERFSIEAELLAKLSHPHIVTIHDFGETGGLFYLVMEFIDGVNLRDLLRDGKLAPEQALAIVPPICDALQYAHDKGIVHRDIKPENLLLDRDGRIKIADFGIASLVGAAEDKSGTPPYMAPEQEHGSVDRRSDIYSLGAVLYEMLTGERPGKDLIAPSRKVSIDVRLDEVVLRALEQKPELRYQNASILKTRVETLVSEMASAAVPAASLGGASNESAQEIDSVTRVFRDSRLSRTAIVGACLGFIHAILLPLVHYRFGNDFSAHPHPDRLPYTFLVYPEWALFVCSLIAMTILGWKAVGEIRRSGGRVRGLGLALFDGLLLPIVVASAACAIGLMFLLRALDQILWSLTGRNPHLGMNSWFALILCLLVLTPLVIRSVWRKVKQPIPPAPGSSGWDAGKQPGRLAIVLASLLVAANVGWLVFAATAVAMSIMSPAFVANARVKPMSEPGGASVDELSGILQSDGLLTRVAEKAGLQTRWKDRLTGDPSRQAEQIVNRMRWNLDVTPILGEPILDIAFHDPDPKQAVEIANALADQLTTERRVIVLEKPTASTKVARLDSTANLERGAVGGAVLGMIIGALTALWLSRGLGSARTESSAEPESKGRPTTVATGNQGEAFGKWALGLFIGAVVGAPVLWGFMGAQEVIVLCGLALLLSLVFGVMSWRSKPGKFAALASGLGLLLLVGFTSYFLTPRPPRGPYEGGGVTSAYTPVKDNLLAAMSARYGAEESRFELGKPMDLDLLFLNHSPIDIVINPHELPPAAWLTVKNSAGARVELKGSNQAASVLKEPRVVKSRDGTGGYAMTLLLLPKDDTTTAKNAKADAMAWVEPGAYTLQFHLRLPPTSYQSDGSSNKEYHSVPLTIEVAGTPSAGVSVQPSDSFGEVVERDLILGEKEELRGLYLEGGNLRSLTQDEYNRGLVEIGDGFKAGPRPVDWFDSKQLDIAIFDRGYDFRIAGRDGEFVLNALPTEKWETATYKDVRDAVAYDSVTKLKSKWKSALTLVSSDGLWAYLKIPPDAELPLTYAMRSGDKRGLLQITARLQNPDGISVRYKLVKNSSSASKDTSPVIPKMYFQEATLVEALDFLRERWPTNVVFDPSITDEQKNAKVTVRWENLTARNAMTALLDSVGLQLIDNPQTGVATIVIQPPDSKLKTSLIPYGQGKVDTSPIIPKMYFEEATLLEALDFLRKQWPTNVVFDQSITDEQKSVKITVRWENLSASQAMTALLDSVGFQLLENPQTGVAKIVNKTSFGSVIERELRVSEETLVQGLGFESGKVLTLSLEEFNRKADDGTERVPNRSFGDWVEAKGIDMYVAAGDKGFGLGGSITEFKLSALPMAAWDTATESVIKEALEHAVMEHDKFSNGLLIPTDAALPLTYALRSGDKRGLLQITARLQNPDGIRLRYKLVHSVPPVKPAPKKQYELSIQFGQNPNDPVVKTDVELGTQFGNFKKAGDRLFSINGQIDEPKNGKFPGSITLGDYNVSEAHKGTGHQGTIPVELELGKPFNHTVVVGIGFIRIITLNEKPAGAEPPTEEPATSKTEAGNGSWTEHLTQADALASFGNLSCETGDLAAAMKKYRAAKEVIEPLVRKEPANKERRNELTALYVKIGDVLEAQGDKAGALAEFRKAQEVDFPDFKTWEEHFIESIGGLYNPTIPFKPEELKQLAANPKSEADFRRLNWLILRAGAEKDASFRYLLDQEELREDEDVNLALIAYDYSVNGNAKALDYLLARLAMERTGGDSSVVIALAFVDEWDRVPKAVKAHVVHADGAGADLMFFCDLSKAYLFPRSSLKHEGKAGEGAPVNLKGKLEQSAAPESEKNASLPPAFGPVIERMVPTLGAGKACLLDLDTGEFHTPPDDIAESLEPNTVEKAELTRAALRWLRESRVEITASPVVSDAIQILGAIMIVPAGEGNSPPGFDDMTPAIVLQTLSGSWLEREINPKVFRSFLSAGLGTHVFITPEGAMGVMEIPAGNGDPAGVKIRYKLLRGAKPGAEAIAAAKAAWDLPPVEPVTELKIPMLDLPDGTGREGYRLTVEPGDGDYVLATLKEYEGHETAGEDTPVKHATNRLLRVPGNSHSEDIFLDSHWIHRPSRENPAEITAVTDRCTLSGFGQQIVITDLDFSGAPDTSAKVGNENRVVAARKWFKFSDYGGDKSRLRMIEFELRVIRKEKAEELAKRHGISLPDENVANWSITLSPEPTKGGENEGP